MYEQMIERSYEDEDNNTKLKRIALNKVQCAFLYSNSFVSLNEPHHLTVSVEERKVILYIVII